MIYFQSSTLDLPTLTRCFPARGRRLVQHAKARKATFVNGSEIVASDEFMGALPGRCYATGGTQVRNFVITPEQSY